MNSFSFYRRMILLGILGLSVGLASLQHAQAQQPTQTITERILIIGDSLSAEYGLKRGTGWVELLKQSLAKTHPSAEIINASISGDTTSGGVSRIKALLARTKPNIVLIELGANDALRGLPLSLTRNNILEMVRLAKETGAQVLLAGMQIPPNYGTEYTTAFRELFAQIAQSEQTGLVPFFLEGIADRPEMFQADTIHPNEQAQPILMGNVLEKLAPMLR
ncbi:arylesterase [Zwartia panacis]|uniref:arylesterase n=1 Tax=Zwartia panacis TaxID=2683345 RepID=UPI0025B5F157|nr:arylesterase [Zwartia panacis]MDN4016866.1 arylesterase [Zwartia panacis]